MREQRKRKALYVNRREELYPSALLQKEYAEEKKKPPAKAKSASKPASPRRRTAR